MANEFQPAVTISLSEVFCHTKMTVKNRHIVSDRKTDTERKRGQKKERKKVRLKDVEIER
jgi:hypothetical protein